MMSKEELRLSCSTIEYQNEIKVTDSQTSLMKRMITISTIKDLNEESMNKEKFLLCFEDILQPDSSYIDMLDMCIKKIKDLGSLSRIERFKYSMFNTSLFKNVNIKKSIAKYLYQTKQKGRVQRNYRQDVARSFVTMDTSTYKEQQKQPYQLKPTIQSTHVQKSVQILKKDRERVLIQTKRLEITNLSKIIKIPKETQKYNNQGQSYAEPSLLNRSLPYEDIFQGKESVYNQGKDESMKDISPRNEYLKDITQTRESNQIKCWQIKHIKNKTSNHHSQQSHDMQIRKLSKDFLSHMNSMQPKFPVRRNMTLRNHINREQNQKNQNFEGHKSQKGQNFLTECLNNYYLNRLIRISLS